MLWNERYTPFGEALLNPAANDNQGGFTSHIKDKSTGLNYMQARYYDPNIGRFLSIDPVTFMDNGNPGYFNRYAYTFNDPINNFDPDGQKVVPTGTKPEIAAINKALDNIKKSNPQSRARFEALDKSKNIHTIRFPKAGEAPQNKVTGNFVDSGNGKGTGSESIVDPTKSVTTTNSDGSKVVNSGETVLTHELLGHGGDTDNGTLDQSRNPKTGELRKEESAMKVENEYKDAVGEKRRDRH